MQSFQPKLVLTVRGRGGLHLDLSLSDETRQALERLLWRTRAAHLGTRASIASSSDDSSISDDDDASIFEAASSIVGSGRSQGSETGLVGTGFVVDDAADALDAAHAAQTAEMAGADEPVATVEIPLNHDSEFFHILASELSVLDRVQACAANAIEREIVTIGNSVTAVSAPQNLVARSDLYPWREIFRTYLDTGVFFSTLESEAHRERSVDDARARLARFSAEVERLRLCQSFKHRDSAALFRRFLAVNEDLLRVLRFQAINRLAIAKILKSPSIPSPLLSSPLLPFSSEARLTAKTPEFDKRTAFGAQQTFPSLVASNPFLASHLAKAICCAMSSKMLTIIPQLDDYLCPVCQSISVKPVRLSCSHVFCVRCLVKLQREAKRFCPMCRRDVVLLADATNLDLGLHNFLKTYFPKEAREKQRENEQEVVLEQWKNVQMRSVGQDGSDGCAVM